MNGKGKDVSRSVVPEKRKEPKPDAVHEKVDILKQKKPKLKDMLLDENFEKLDEKHVKSITLHRLNDGDRLWTHLNTALHINNKEKADKTKYETKDKNYQILRNDSLFDGDERAEEYFKHDNCRGKTYSRFCSPCAFLAHNEAFNKVNRYYSYHSLVESYPALGQILKAVEANGLEDWIGKYTAFMIDKTMDEQRP
ncbi:17612_t:CDS:2, partial [Funneliformis geosporum]